MSADARAAAAIIAERAPGFTPRVGLILGSGIGGLADAIESPLAIAYGDLPGFPRPTIEGHAGRLVLGEWGGVPVACLQGRAHLYEGVAPQAVQTPTRTLCAAGCEALIVTCAAGSLRHEAGPGSLMMLTDHINMLPANPLAGANDESFGPRFPAMSGAYDAEFQARLRAAAAALGIALHEGVYIACLGPSFETPAEIRAFRALGADAVGMSTVPEVIVARHAGLRVAGLAVLTNLAAGMTDDEITHEQTLEAAGAAAADLSALLLAFLREIGDTGRDDG